ncbi:Phosphatidylinositol 3,5-bisphosphate-binding protein [Rhodotorula toruloides]
MALHLPAHTLSDEEPSPVTAVHLNSDGSVFATSTTRGWVVYRTNPLEAVTRRDLPDSSLKIVLPLERTNLLFLVGGPPSPLYPPNKVVFWDDKAKQAVAELEFREEVLGLAARRDRLVVALKRRVLVFVLGGGVTGIWREGVYETTENPKGLVALATKPGSTLLAFPGRQPGQIQVVRLPPLDPLMPPLPPPPSHDPTSATYPSVSIILAHTTSLSALSTTPDGSLIASASNKGTLVRVWDAQTSYLVKELRRGTDWAQIFGISFRADGGAVAVSSDKGTMHVWDLKRTREESQAERGTDSGSSTPRQKQLSLLKPYLPKYFSSEWSHSQFRLPPPAPPASRLPFSLSNPSPYPATPFTPVPKEGEGRAPPLTVEDDVCLCAWVEVDVEGEEDTGTPASPPTDPSNRRISTSSSARPSSSPSAQPTRTRPPSSHEKENFRTHPPPSRPSTTSAATPYTPSSQPPAPSKKKTESQLIAITHSGGWYRIAFDQPTGGEEKGAKGKGKEKGKEKAEGGAGGASGSSTPRSSTAGTRNATSIAGGKKREDGPVGLGKDSTSDCRLVEYRRFGGDKDGW